MSSNTLILHLTFDTSMLSAHIIAGNKSNKNIPYRPTTIVGKNK